MATISTIYDAKSIVINKSFARAILVTGFVVMMSLGAYIRIPLPFTPVPITLQTFFVILSGAVLGKKFGSFAQISYVALGILGAPVFQGYGAGFLYFLGPTGGYLIGFVLASFVVGALIDRKEKSHHLAYVMLAMSLGLFTVYLSGIAWLMIGHKFAFTTAVSLGFVPFIPGAIAKLITASWIYRKIESRTSLLLK